MRKEEAEILKEHNNYLKEQNTLLKDQNAILWGMAETLKQNRKILTMIEDEIYRINKEGKQNGNKKEPEGKTEQTD